MPRPCNFSRTNFDNIMRTQIDSLLTSDCVPEARRLAEDWVLNSPDDPILALQYAGMTQIFCGDPVAAENSFRSALALDPELPRNLANLGIALMTQGRYQEGLPLYEARYREGLIATDSVSFKELDPGLQWRGEPLHGKRLLLVGEQGLGDQIQFIRFASELRALGAQQILVSLRSELVEILSSAPDVHSAFTQIPSDKEYDVWCPMMSTAMHLQLQSAKSPDKIPYLFPPELRISAWHSLLHNWFQNKFKIGITWAGASGNSVDGRRSLPFSDTLNLLQRLPDSAIVSLQIGSSGMESLDVQCKNGMIPLLDLLTDLTETAAAIMNLDLVISVDTAVAHLAGALGKPVWLLLPAGPDWRWGLQGDYTPWYPSMRIFRQKTPGNWTDVIDSVVNEYKMY